MIISASRRTDIPAFYSPWFFNRIKEGYVLVPNPFNSKMISKVSLNPAVIDCIVFWTKNPAPMIEKLDKLEDYKYYFQFTLNPYGEKLENNLPSVAKRIDIFKRLSDKIGREKVIWRYDPILTNEEFNVSFHKEAFARIADGLKDHTEKCMLGFYLDIQNVTGSKLRQPDVLMSTGEIANPEAPAAEQRYVMKSVRQESGTLLPTLGITFEY